MDRVIVTGSDGFIGKILVASLRKLKFEVIEVSRKLGDVTDKSLWDKLPKSDVVIHLAALSNIPKSWSEPHEFVNINVGGVINALEYCAKHNARIIFSSTYVYGAPKELPVKESHGKNPNNPYALSKYLAEKSCKFYSENMGVKTIILRFFNIYGAGQDKSFLIPSIISQVRKNSKVVLNDLRPKRDYIYVKDAVDSIVKSISIEKKFSIINIGSGVSYSVKSVANIILEKMNADLSLSERKDVRKNEINDVIADISNARKVLGWEPKYSLASGIKEMIDSS